MKRKNADYKQPENSSSTLREPVVNYHPNHNKIDNQHFAFISEDELSTNCMPLAESKRLLLERVHKDFHK